MVASTATSEPSTCVRKRRSAATTPPRAARTPMPTHLIDPFPPRHLAPTAACRVHLSQPTRARDTRRQLALPVTFVLPHREHPAPFASELADVAQKCLRVEPPLPSSSLLLLVLQWEPRPQLLALQHHPRLRLVLLPQLRLHHPPLVLLPQQPLPPSPAPVVRSRHRRVQRSLSVGLLRIRSTSPKTTYSALCCNTEQPTTRLLAVQDAMSSSSRTRKLRLT